MNMIFLIGMPGAGKTFWARKLSVEHGYEAIDMDEMVEKREGIMISDIFKTKGEEYFRAAEAACLQDLINEYKHKRLVVACGGGTPVHGNNLEMMKQNGCVVYLKVDTDTLAGRIKDNIPARPMFTNKDDINEAVDKLLSARKGYYEQAHHIVEVNKASIVNFDKILESCISRQ